MTESVTLHSSWRGIVSSFLGAGIVCTVGAFALVAGGVSVPTVVLALFGVGLLGGVAVDYPIATTFDQEGLVRRSALRRHRIEWSTVRTLSRARGPRRGLRTIALGGLVAVVGRRRYLLVDQVEAGSEYDRLESAVGPSGRELLASVIRPADAVVPTWTYRRRRWTVQPDDG